MRPESILWFERVYIGRIVLNVALAGYSLYWMGQGGMVGPTIPGFTGIMIAGAAITLLFNLALLYFIGRRASMIAKWIFVVSTLLALLSVVRAVMAPNLLPAFLKMGPLLGVGLDFTMIMLLFQPDSSDWFARRGVVEDDLADTFS